MDRQVSSWRVVPVVARIILSSPGWHRRSDRVKAVGGLTKRAFPELGLGGPVPELRVSDPDQFRVGAIFRCRGPQLSLGDVDNKMAADQ